MNPYDPPSSTSPLAADAETGDIDRITATFLFSPEYLVVTLKRYREQHFGFRIWKWVRCMVAFLLVMFAVAGLFIPQYGVSAFMLVCAALMLFPRTIDDFLARRNFRKSPHCNIQQTIQISDAGLQSRSELQESTLKWTAFSRAVIFDDGVLIFQGKKMVNWIPDSALQENGDAAKLRKLVESKLPTNHPL